MPRERVLGRSEVEFGLALSFYREREKDGPDVRDAVTGRAGEKGKQVGLSWFQGLDWASRPQAGFGLVSGFYFLVFPSLFLSYFYSFSNSTI